jgi:hypothetical protein
MNLDINPLEEYINSIKRNTNFLHRLLTPKISIPLLAIFITVISVIALNN